ncbi:hypothetical protein NDU88_005815 [Pleurodeles waltl]|uniref:Uncharacterized protein n=1 Tax=Pleurodeles waltl TaxID=8319 RepID=A0AAV7VMC1_PLEWA|nr:hypothetical protein NDU88_005815 [Pleurodeles waltl]
MLEAVNVAVCDGLDSADPDSAHGVPDAPRRAGIPIGSLQCPQEGGAVIRTVEVMPKKLIERRRTEETIERRRTEEPTDEGTTGKGGEQEEATVGGFRRYREEDGSEKPIPSRSRPLDKDCWPRGALA